MKKKLTPSGNGWLLHFSKPLLKILGYSPTETKVLITAKSEILHIEPINPNDFEKYENNMVRGFQKSGTSYGVYFPNALLEILEVNPETDFLNIEIDENKLKIKKA